MVCIPLRLMMGRRRRAAPATEQTPHTCTRCSESHQSVSYRMRALLTFTQLPRRQPPPTAKGSTDQVDYRDRLWWVVACESRLVYVLLTVWAVCNVYEPSYAAAVGRGDNAFLFSALGGAEEAFAGARNMEQKTEGVQFLLRAPARWRLYSSSSSSIPYFEEHRPM